MLESVAKVLRGIQVQNVPRLEPTLTNIFSHDSLSYQLQEKFGPITSSIFSVGNNVKLNTSPFIYLFRTRAITASSLKVLTKPENYRDSHENQRETV